MISLPDFQLMPQVDAALREDIRSGDITTGSLIPYGLAGKADMNFRVAGLVCGLDIARLIFLALDPGAQVDIFCSDGTAVDAGATVLRVRGEGRALLTAERVALNFVQRLSAISTLTAEFVERVQGTRAQIADTRKTTPGLRMLEKYAVRCGGGLNHRFALDDLVLIKDNHIALCGGIATAVERARNAVGHAVKIEVECDTLQQVGEAAAAGADIILLDNMTLDQLLASVELIGGRALAEASGGVNLASVAGIAATGVDIISVGVLTHGMASLDIGLEMEL